MPERPRRASAKARICRRGPSFGGEGEVDVGPVEAAQEHPRGTAVEQLLDDLVAGLGVGRGGEGRQRDVQHPPQVADPQVVRAEVVAPLAHAMRLVHRDEADIRPPQHPLGAARGEPLRREVEELQRPRLHRRPHRVGLLGRVARGQGARLDAGRPERAHLVAHERDQRGDDDRDARAQQRGELVAERLAAAGGHDGEGVLAHGHSAHDLLLPGAEVVVAEDLAQHRARVGGGGRERVERWRSGVGHGRDAGRLRGKAPIWHRGPSRARRGGHRARDAPTRPGPRAGASAAQASPGAPGRDGGSVDGDRVTPGQAEARKPFARAVAPDDLPSLDGAPPASRLQPGASSGCLCPRRHGIRDGAGSKNGTRGRGVASLPPRRSRRAGRWRSTSWPSRPSAGAHGRDRSASGCPRRRSA